jgi:hypothetical protein
MTKIQKSVLVVVAAAALATTLSVGSASAQYNPLFFKHYEEGELPPSDPCVAKGFLDGTLGIITKGIVGGFVQGNKEMFDCIK